ncbi:MAG: hypothetical protein A2622_12340 [Bdellovibrionales bacterium RIFCSPHIGHO2_01_FULL_40_29]|nr:MAG: hypothetical protein A2622_12340 [Bdellovibrionales bacterium RIFCSPHIGHO2_01_FULL_40_29]OFZ32974.1 MAG: hypothetical protein A3D17_09650 [Bdellovibrionales bacterium RIFCSPHIGHO2_02_FULL_40_15]
MLPRKKESKKWSALPSEFANQIKTVFEDNFKGHLSGKSIKVAGRIYPSEIVLRVGVHRNGELRHHNFEVSLDHSATTQNTIPQIHLAVDAIASLMIDFFENEETHELPYVWREIPFENQQIWVQFTTENPDLESEANKLLGLDPDRLINEEINDDVDTSTPQLFKSKKKKDDLH